MPELFSETKHRDALPPAKEDVTDKDQTSGWRRRAAAWAVLPKNKPGADADKGSSPNPVLADANKGSFQPDSDPESWASNEAEQIRRCHLLKIGKMSQIP